MQERPVWKNILSIVLCLFVVIRLVMMCNKSSDKSYSEKSYEDANFPIQQSSYKYDSDSYKDESASNDLFYENYDSINKMNDVQMAIFKVIKVKKDTLLPLDFNSKIKIEAKSFIQKNYDDSLQIAVKLPDNTSLFLHSYSSKNDMLENFKAIKKNKNLGNISTEIDKKNSKIINYSYTYKDKKYSGCALIAKEDEQFTSFEFENNKMSKSEIYLLAITYLTNMLK
ncbi:hypothetical protein [Chryseobacterium luquanense]|uniref:Lipoprotein n=1 Tax=Chryseobacterium luquanense TaxID=2983766 RepID=A0ABT3Y6Z9_9FLAO|nr:hypothetical protein [Chryseobacterium luquanense]MCX8533930.1 hypothetical protein [Chryseobacterium luquanense]